MTAKIEFTDKPLFALGTRAPAAAVGRLTPASFNTKDVIVELSSSAKARSEQSATTASSVFSRFTNGLQNLVSGIDKINQQLAETPEGSPMYSALVEERAKLEEQLHHVADANGGGSTGLNSLKDFLQAAGNALNQGAGLDSFSALGTALFGSDGNAFLQRGGIAALQQLGNLLGTLDTTGVSLDDPAAFSRFSDSVTQLSQLFKGVTPLVAQEGSSTPVVASDGPSKPLQLTELSFEAAGQVALGLRSAKGEDLLRAAVSGISPDLVNTLVLKPNEDEFSKREKKRHEFLVGETEDDFSSSTI